MNGCPLWFNVLPENEQQLSSKARGELGQRMRNVAVPDVTAVSQMLMAVSRIPVHCGVKNRPKRFKCHGQVTFTELSATVPKATTVLPECTSCSLENPTECAGELCAGNVFWCLLEGVLPGIML